MAQLLLKRDGIKVTLDLRIGKKGADGFNGADGEDGRGILSNELLSTVGLVKTYRITYTDNTTFDYEVRDGEDGEDGAPAVLPPNIVIDPNYIHTDNNYTDEDKIEVGKIAAKENTGVAQTLVTQLIDGATDNTLKKLQDKITAINAIIGGNTPDGDNIVNTVAELLAVFSTFPEGSDMVTLLTAKLNTSDVYNALDQLLAGKALDARQGKVLKDLCDGLRTDLTNHNHSGTYEPANANIQTSVKKVETLTNLGGQLTGFLSPILVDVSYNPTNRTVTLTGDITAFWQGINMTEKVAEWVSGWTSVPHIAADGSYFLYFNGTSFVWDTVAWDFKQLMIAMAYRDGANFCLRECHGLQDWQSHEANHNNIGTSLRSGADLTGVTLNVTTPASRRPIISQALVYDEDLPSLLPALNNSLYTRLYLSGANTANVEVDQTDIIENTAGNRFNYNLFTGGVWTRTQAVNNAYGKIFLMAIPTTSDADCAKRRYVWIMPQQVSTTLATIQALTPASLSLGQIGGALAEYVFVQEIIVRATATDWNVVSTAKLTGNKRFQSVTSGNFLSSVAVNSSITGDGTVSNPLSVSHVNVGSKNGETAFQHVDASTTKPTLVANDKMVIFDSVTNTAKLANQDYDIYNVTTKIPLTAGQYYTATTARAAVPTSIKKLGLKITYATASGVWVEETFIGSDVSWWGTDSNWLEINKQNSLGFSDAFYTGILDITSSNGVITANITSAYVLSPSISINLAPITNTSLSFNYSYGDYYVLWIDMITKQFGYNAWNTYVHNTNKFILCRFTGDMNVQKNNVQSLIVNGYSYSLKTIYTKSYITANDIALYNGYVIFNNTNKTIGFSEGGILSRGGSFIGISGQSASISALGTNDYGVYTKVSDGSILLFPYNQNGSSTLEDYFCVARISIVNGSVTKVHYCISDYVLNGIKFLKFTPENQLNSSNTASITYCEIGDSISWQFDGKLENFASEGTGTGYKVIGGYGQKICKKFNIPYANHKSHGLNGRAIPEYISEILTHTSSDLVYDVPKDADLYTIFLGTNDWGKATTLGDESDYLNDTLVAGNGSTFTTYGGLRKLIDYVRSIETTTKDKTIVFITPIGFGAYKGYNNTTTATWVYDVNGKIIERANAANVKMSDIVNAIKFAANQIGAYVIDLYNYGGIIQKNRLNIELTMNGSNPYVYQSILVDNLHPTIKGQKLLGNIISDELSKIIPIDTF